MHSFRSTFKQAMVNCDIIRNGIKIDTRLGLIHDTKDCNFISFDYDVDVQIGDVISVPLKNKNYNITKTDIRLFQGKRYCLDAYFENNYINGITTNIFNTYNPNNSVIGTQENVTLNINDCFNNLQKQIEQQTEDKEQLQELLEVIKSEMSNNQINNSAFTKFKVLFIKHAPWLVPALSQIIAAWIQRG